MKIRIDKYKKENYDTNLATFGDCYLHALGSKRVYHNKNVRVNIKTGTVEIKNHVLKADVEIKI